MAKERPALTSLSGVLARKVTPLADAAPPDPAPTPEGEKKDKRVQVIVRMTEAERKALRQIALDQDTTAQALAEAAIQDILRRHGKTS